MFVGETFNRDGMDLISDYPAASFFMSEGDKCLISRVCKIIQMR